jgi:hypothetical protein
MCSRGVLATPWRDDLRVGAAERDGDLYVAFHADKPWKGRLTFDFPRWKEQFHLPVNYPRINELTEWCVVSPEDAYEVIVNDQPAKTMTGAELIAGLPIDLNKAGDVRVIVRNAARK